MSIDWQTTVAQLDADPDVTTPAGVAVLSALVSAGHAYDLAGKPGPFLESSQHQAWARLRPSERLGVAEPAYLEPAAYLHPFAAVGSRAPLTRDPALPDSAPSSAKTAYAFWRARDVEVSRRIASYYIAKERDREQATRPQGPSNSAIQGALTSALSAALEFLAG